jgi:Uma2 family endonuclease
MEIFIKTESLGLTEEQFFHFCQENDALRIERNSNGEIIIMAPTGSETGWYNSNITTELSLWNRQTKSGYVFDSSSGFTLPDGSVRSPDAAFILKHKWENLSTASRKKFAPVCPDFIIELASESDSADFLKEKMEEYIKNGCQLCWLIDPELKKTTIYRSNGKVESVPFNQLLSGENILPGFDLNLDKLFRKD